MTAEQLIEKGYKEFKDSWKQSKKAFQKRFTDDLGIKYFLNFYMYNHTEISEGRDTDDRWQVEVQFNNKTPNFTVNIEMFSFWTVENQWEHPTTNLEEVENWFEKLFHTMNFEYYELKNY